MKCIRIGNESDALSTVKTKKIDKGQLMRKSSERSCRPGVSNKLSLFVKVGYEEKKSKTFSFHTAM